MQVSGVDLLACGSIPTLPTTQTTTPSTKHPISDSVCKHSLQISHLSVYQDYRVMNELSRTLSETFPAWGLHAPSSMHVASLHPHPIECGNIGSRLRDSRATHGFFSACCTCIRASFSPHAEISTRSFVLTAATAPTAIYAEQPRCIVTCS
jgi:hypothetical protein